MLWQKSAAMVLEDRNPSMPFETEGLEAPQRLPTAEYMPTSCLPTSSCVCWRLAATVGLISFTLGAPVSLQEQHDHPRKPGTVIYHLLVLQSLTEQHQEVISIPSCSKGSHCLYALPALCLLPAHLPASGQEHSSMGQQDQLPENVPS